MPQTLQVLLVVIGLGLIGGVAGHSIHARNVKPARKPVRRKAELKLTGTEDSVLIEKYVSLGWVGDAGVGAVAGFLAFALAKGGNKIIVIGSEEPLSLTLAQMGIVLLGGIGGGAFIEKLLTAQFDSALKNAMIGATKNNPDIELKISE